MIAFASLVLGLVVGVVPIQFVVQESVASIEVTLDGSPVGRLTGQPWSIQLDLGKELAPHEVVARAFSKDGRPVGEVRQSLNLPRPLAEARIVLGNDSGKEPPSAQVLSGSVLGTPTAIRATFDGRNVPADSSGRLSLPSYDRSKTHILAARVEFAGGLSAEVATVVGGTAAAESGNALTAIPVRRRGKGRLPPLDKLQNWFARQGQPLKVLAVERPPAEVILVRDADGTQARALLGQWRDAPRGVGPGGFPNPAPDRSEPRLDSEDRVRVAWPVPRRTEGSHAHSELFEQSGEYTGENAGFRSLLTRSWRSVDDGVPEYRTAEAVAVAGMRALSERSRRAVVLVVKAQPDASAFDPETARRYLDLIHVPLFVWSLDPSSSSSSGWGVAEDISSPSRLEKAVHRLKEELDRQEIVWVAGSSLPQEIRLTANADGFEIVGAGRADLVAAAPAAAGEPPPPIHAEAVKESKAESRTTPGPASAVQESAEVHVMNLDVFAADSKGVFVPDLVPSDFQVYVDGHLHKIDYFSRVDPPPAMGAGATGTPNANPSPTSPRRLLLYLELSHISAADRERTVGALREFIDRMAPGDTARIVAWDGRSREVTGWTGDKPALLAGLDQARKIRSGVRLEAEQRALLSVDGADAGLQGDLPDEGVDAIGRNRAAAHLDEERTEIVAMLRDLDNQIATLSVIDGRRSILFVSGGLEVRAGSTLSVYASPSGPSNGLDTRTAVADLAPILRHANSSRVTFFPVDVRGVSQSARFENQESLRRLADETGGLAVINSNDVGVALARIDDASSRYYSIGVTLSADAARGFREVRIETTRPGLSVRYRKGFASLSPTEQAADVARAALLTRVEEHGIRVSAQPGAATPSGNARTVPLKVSVPAEDLVFLPKQGGSSGTAEVFIAAMDESGRMSDVSRREVTFRPEDCPAARCSFSFQLGTKKGKTRVAVTVRDISGKRGTAVLELSIP